MIKNKDPPRKTPLPKRKKAPSNMPRPPRMQGLQVVDSWSSRPGEPFAGLPKCFEAAGQKEVSCAGPRGRVLGAGGAMQCHNKISRKKQAVAKRTAEK
jgi:hypothetical protein